MSMSEYLLSTPPVLTFWCLMLLFSHNELTSQYSFLLVVFMFSCQHQLDDEGEVAGALFSRRSSSEWPFLLDYLIPCQKQ